VMASDGGERAATATSDNLGESYSARSKDKSLSPKEREAALYFITAENHLHEEQADLSLQNAEEALTRFRQLGDEVGVIDTMRIIIHVYIFKDRRKEANKMVKDELQRIRDGKDSRGEGKMLLSLAEVNTERRGYKNREDAKSYAMEALEIFRKEGDRKFQAYSLICLLNINMKWRGDKSVSCQAALDAALEARSLMKAIGDRRGEALACHGIAVSQIRAEVNGAVIRGSPGGWEAAADESVQLFREAKQHKMEAFEKVCIAQWNLGRNPRKARRLAQEAMQFCQEKKSRQESAALGVLVQSYLRVKDMSQDFMDKEAEQAAQLAKAGVARFKELGDRFGQAAALHSLVLTLQAKGEKKEAMVAAEQAADIYKEVGEKGGETSMLQILSQLHLEEKQPEKAHQIAQEVAGMDISLHETSIAQETVYEAFLQQADYEEAMKTAENLVALCNDKNDKKREAIARLMIANVHYSQRDFAQCVLVAREAQALLHDISAWADEASALRIVAEAYMANQQLPLALKAVERSVRLLRGKNKNAEEAHSLYVTAQIHLQMMSEDKMKARRGQPAFKTALAEAMKAADSAVSYARNAKLKSSHGQALITLGQLELVGLQCDDALKTADEALAIFEELKDEPQKANVMCLQADTHFTNGNENKALVLVNKALAIFQDYKDRRGEWIAMNILEQITGPAEEQAPSQEEWTAEQWAQWEQWKQQQTSAQQQQQTPKMPEALQKAQASQPRKQTELVGQKLEMRSLSADTVRQRLIEIVRFTVDMEDNEEIELDVPLMQVGVTSRTAVGLRNTLSEELPGVDLPFTLIFDYPSVAAISDMVLEATGAG